MSPQAVDIIVKEVITEQLGVNPEEVTPQASFVVDLGADSLDVVELGLALEDRFDIEIPDEDLERMVTVQDLTDYIAKKTQR